MPSSLFSTYSQGENRTTASILAVLRSLSIARTERLLGAIMEQELQLVSFANQPGRGGQGVPDAAIVSSCRLLVETKTAPNAVRREQIDRHLARLDEANEEQRFLLVLTPDVTAPRELEAITDERLVWASFASLHQAVDDLLSDEREVVSEREAYLLRELQLFLTECGVLGPRADVVVVAARVAWHEYNEVSAYVCQPDRTIQAGPRFAFYVGGRIQRKVPKVVCVHEHVLFEKGQQFEDDHLRHVVERLLEKESRRPGTEQKVILLTDPDEADTIELPRMVVNDLVSANGRPIAFTQGQRYVSLERLLKADRTSQLV